MLMKPLLHVRVFAAVTFCGILGATDLSAQNPAPRPTPLPGPTTVPIGAPRPPVKQPPAEAPRINPEDLPPDLELTLSPSSSSAAPREFRVRNSGFGDAGNASLLRVTLRLLPLDDESRRDATLNSLLVISGGLAELCPLPYSDFQAAIDPLAAGASQVVSQGGTRVDSGVRSVGPAAARPSTRVLDHSYIREIEVRLVCVYELRATVDANGEVTEANERNNEIVHTFVREVTLRSFSLPFGATQR